jgi:hypothetical protein
MKLLLKKLKTYFRKHKANKIESSGKKIKIIIFAGLALSLNYESQVVTERVIENQKQESNSCDDSHNSGKVIQTGNGIILESQQEVSDTSSNDMDEIILVQGDGVLPGADGFPLNNNPRRRHPFGRPRMRGTGINVDPPQNIHGLGNILEAPKVGSFRKVELV